MQFPCNGRILLLILRHQPRDEIWAHVQNHVFYFDDGAPCWEHLLMLQGKFGVEYLRQSVRAPEKSKTSRTRIWSAGHILAICVRNVIKLITSRTLSLTAGRIWHDVVRDDFHLPVGITPSSPCEAAVYVISEFRRGYARSNPTFHPRKGPVSRTEHQKCSDEELVKSTPVCSRKHIVCGISAAPSPQTKRRV